jgi:hypothetical protein
MRKIIELGESIRLYMGYADVDTNSAVDPIVLSAIFKRPDGTTLTITYPHTDFVREAAGEYYVRVLTTQIGTWAYRIYAETSPFDKDVRDGKFDVEPSL